MLKLPDLTMPSQAPGLRAVVLEVQVGVVELGREELAEDLVEILESRS